MMKFRAITAAASAVAMAASMSVSAPAQAQADPFLGQLMLTGYNFCPRGWANTDGQLLAISQNSALFSLFGTQFGGDGRTTFALPDLRGRAPIGRGQGAGLAPYNVGQLGGTESFTMTEAQMPSHSHTGTIRANPFAANSDQPVRNYIARSPVGTNTYFSGDAPEFYLGANSLRINAAGGSQAVNKRSPYIAMQWCVATVGIFPSRN